jgi:hypothetical protein
MPPTRSRDLWFGDDAPAWWHRARHAYDRSVTLSARLDPRYVLAAAGAIGKAIHRAHLCSPSPDRLAELFGPARRDRLNAIARDISGLRYQNRALVSVVQQRGIAVLERFVDPASVAGLARFREGPPVIFVTWHLGPAFALGGAFKRVGLRVFVVRRAVGYRTTAHLDVATTAGGPDARAAVFRQALARVRDGGHVIMAADGLEAGLTPPVRCLDRWVPMARGPFALARLTGAPLIPVVAQWTDDGRIRIVVGDRLAGAAAGAAFETAQAAAAADWLDVYLRLSPAQLWLCSLRWLLDAARA